MKLNLSQSFACTFLYDFDSKYNVTKKFFSASVKVVIFRESCYQ